MWVFYLFRSIAFRYTLEITAFTLWLVIFIPTGTEAQNNRSARMDNLISRLDSVVRARRSFVSPSALKASKEDIKPLFNGSKSKKNRTANLSLLEAERSNTLKDWGLNMKAGYMQNLKQGVFNVEGIFYKRRYQLGLDWDILDGGWQDNRFKAKQLQREIQIKKVQKEKEYQEERYQRDREHLKMIMQQRTTEIRKRYLEVLKVKQNELKELYDLGYKTWDEVLESFAEVTKTRLMLEESKGQNQPNTEIQNEYQDLRFPLPVLTVDTEPLIQAVQNNNRRAYVDSLAVENIKEKYLPWRDISLTANLSYNYYDRSSQQLPITTSQDREYFSFGVNLSVPVSIFKSNRELYPKALREQQHYQNQREDNTALRKLREYHTDYEGLKKQYLNLYYRYLRQSKEIDGEEAKSQISASEYSPAHLLDLLISQYQNLWERTDLKEKMYLKLLQLGNLAPKVPFTQYVHVWNPPSLRKHDKIASGIYIWSGTFRKLSNAFLLDYLTSRQFETVLLSPGSPESEKDRKLADFIRNARLKGLKVQLMKGSNVLFRRDKRSSIKKFFSDAKRLGADGVHLDVEPQTLKDWSKNKERYLAQYLQMAKYAHHLAHQLNLKFSVSIPDYYDNILKELAPVTDEIYVMVYGEKEVHKIADKLEKERALKDTDNYSLGFTVSLRPQDFNSINEMRNLMKTLHHDIKIKRYAVHDLETLMKAN